MNAENCETGNNGGGSTSGHQLSAREHWEKVYKTNEENKLGWYQTKATPSLELIEKSNINRDDLIIDIGSGSSLLIDNLLASGYENIIATDISETALNISKKRLGTEVASKVKWIVDDLTESKELIKLKNISLWHDRAVFHFLTNKKDREAYLNLLNNTVRKGGHIIIATFNLHGAEMCSGLPVHRYDARMIASHLGSDFMLIQSFDYIYKMPSEDTREYVYVLFQRIK